MQTILYFQINLCIIDRTSILTVASIGDMKVFIIFYGSLQDSNVTDDSNNAYMRAVVSFNYYNGGFADGDIMSLFSENDTYPEMTEMGFSNVSWTEIPHNLVNLFPNLQTIEVTKTTLTSVPSIFPWTNKMALLPDNLTRSPLMQNHYAGADFLNIPNNIFRRMYNLAYNSITDLCTPLTGFLQKISFKNNQIQELCADSFVYVTELEHLDLSSNEISHLPPGVFRGQIKLRFLSLMNNSLTNISADVFNETTSLIVLKLSNNSISYIAPGAFSRLNKLQKLYLQNNALTFLDPGSFPLDSIQLETLYLNSNPLKELPEIVFWMRGLKLADLKFTDITFENFTEYLLNMNVNNVLMSIVDSGSDGDPSDLLRQEINPTVIDLSFSKIDSLTIETMSNEVKLFAILLLHFKFILTENPLHCDCHMNMGVKYINHFISNKTITQPDDLFDSWICQSPKELAGAPYVKIRPEQTVCPVNVSGCPEECECFERPVSGRLIVDCRNKDLVRIHEHLPEGTLELVYKGNNISELHGVEAFRRVYSLDISYNKVKTIDQNTFRMMRALRRLDLRSNLLAYIPENIKGLALEQGYLSHNPLHCDCNTKWMTYWLKDSSSMVMDKGMVNCATDGSDRYVITDTEDDKFVCRDFNPKFDEKAIVITSIVSSVMGILIVALLLLVYTFRLEVKVMLFVYFGVHPFDSDHNFTEEYIDCVIVHSGLETDWVMEKLVNVLENADHMFVVCDMARDFVVGFSFQENLTKTVNHSKRIIFLISKDWKPVSDKFAVAWGIAQGKMKESKSNLVSL